MAHSLLSIAAWTARRLPMPVKRLLYRIDPLARLIRAGLNRAAPAGLTSVEIAAGGLAGWRMNLDLQAEKDYWLGTYEPDLQAALVDWARQGMVVFDVGANIGYISLLFARHVDESGRVFAFEALPTNQERLVDNLALNGVQDRVQVFCGAVVDSKRLVQFNVAPSGGMGKVEGSAGRQDVSYAERLAVPGISLDEFVFQDANPAPDIVKMDIEGGEVLALPGMRRLLAENPPLMLIELHGRQAAQVVWENLTQSGYQICRMEAGYTPVRSVEDMDWKAYVVAFPPGFSRGAH